MRLAAVWGLVRLGLHDESEAGEFFLHAPEVAAERFNTGRSCASFAVGDTVAATTEEGANQFASLPGVETGLLQFFAKTGEISRGEGIGGRLQGDPQISP